MQGGPLNLDAAASHVSLHPSEVFSGRAAIQTPYAEYNVGADLPQMTERERLKMSKRVDKEERSMRAAAEAAQVRGVRDPDARGAALGFLNAVCSMMQGGLCVLRGLFDGSARGAELRYSWLTGWVRRTTACGLLLKQHRYELHKIYAVVGRRRATWYHGGPWSKCSRHITT